MTLHVLLLHQFFFISFDGDLLVLMLEHVPWKIL